MARSCGSGTVKRNWLPRQNVLVYKSLSNILISLNSAFSSLDEDVTKSLACHTLHYKNISNAKAP